MSRSRWWSSTILVAVVIAGSACTQEPVEATTISPAVAADKTKEIAEKTDVITDASITARVSAKFIEETLLAGDDINIDTTDRVVTLKGTVRSGSAKARAGAIAGGTEGVSRLVNQLVVK